MISKIRTILETEKAEYFCITFLFHCIVLLLLSLFFGISIRENLRIITISSIEDEAIVDHQEIIMPETHTFDDINTSLTDNPIIDKEESSLQINDADVPSAVPLEVFSENSSLVASDAINQSVSGLNSSIGQGFSAESSSGGALDRLTQEIILSAEYKDTNVVWLFDSSISMTHQRDYVSKRFKKILDELDFAQTKHEVKHCIYSFGKNLLRITSEFTDICGILQSSIDSIEIDESGIENTFASIGKISQDNYKQGHRLLVIVFTDEIGDDIQLLDTVSKLVQNKGVMVFAVGSPAPFGKSSTQFKFVDFDPSYDQKEKWVEIQQGPETLFDITLDLKTLPIDDETLDSGFGPFGLSKLCLDSGGAFLSVHPNRSKDKVTKNNTSPLSSYISRFFDHRTMNKYKPDYRSLMLQTKEYSSDKVKQALVSASKVPLHIFGHQTLRFKAHNDGAFAQELSMAQRFSAKIEPSIYKINDILSQVEKLSDKITEPRILASYYLSMGRILATKCRIESYNLILAQAKSGIKKQDPKTNIWILVPDSEFKVDNSVLNKNFQASQKYLKYIVDNFPDTPWALIAKEELKMPMGYKWIEHYEEPPKPNNGGGGNNNPGDDKAGPKLIPKPQRKIDKI